MTDITIEDKEEIATIVIDQDEDALARCSNCGNVIISKHYLIDCKFHCEGCNAYFKNAENNYVAEQLTKNFFKTRP